MKERMKNMQNIECLDVSTVQLLRSTWSV